MGGRVQADLQLVCGCMCVCVCVCVCVWRGGHMENVTREKVYNTRVHMQVAHASLSTMHVQVKAMCMCTLG